MFRRNIASAIADLPLLADGNGKTSSTVATFRRKVAWGVVPEIDWNAGGYRSREIVPKSNWMAEVSQGQKRDDRERKRRLAQLGDVHADPAVMEAQVGMDRAQEQVLAELNITPEELNSGSISPEIRAQLESHPLIQDAYNKYREAHRVYVEKHSPTGGYFENFMEAMKNDEKPWEEWSRNLASRSSR